MDNKIKFDGNKLFQIRKEKKMSQEKLALAIGVSRQTIYLWESNSSLPDVEKVSKICKVLEINLSDLVDGVEEPINKQGNDDIKEITKVEENKKGLKKKIITIIMILLIFVFVIHMIFSTIKFVRLKKILDKWEEIDQQDFYYMKIQESLVNRNEKNFDDFCEKYYQNGVLKIIWKDSSNRIQNIIIYDRPEKKKYVVNFDEKTYVKHQLKENDNIFKLSSNFNEYFKFSNNDFLNYLFCLNPNFNISYNDSYEMKMNGVARKVIDSQTGLLNYEMTLDSNMSHVERFYQIELNTDKDFEINLDEYTEVTE
ncbi:MAG: helix-turn-helix transcriptional regulator [Clostridia bacterium]|nr:helix-turn-helix transcriptional regulator [Clostridia bacterium]